jgi:DNA-binding transcriptional regulator YiaG
LALAVAAILALAFALPLTRDELRWSIASRHDSVLSYAAYLAAWPDGRHAGEAKQRFDERSWAAAQAANTTAAFEEYLRSTPRGRHGVEARDAIERHRWMAARATNTVQAYERFLADHPGGHFASEARSRLLQLHVRAWAAQVARTHDSRDPLDKLAARSADELAEVFKAITAALKGRTGEQVEAIDGLMVAVKYDGVWSGDKLQRVALQRCAARLRQLPAASIAEWQKALASVHRDGVSEIWAAMFMTDVDRLFPNDRFDAQTATQLARRLRALPRATVDAIREKLALSRAEVGSRLVVEDWFFDGDRPSGPAAAALAAVLNEPSPDPVPAKESAAAPH